jgi:MFS family permease
MSDALLKVSKGFKLVYIGLILMVLAFVVGVVGIFAVGGAMVAANPGPGGGAGALGLMAVVLGLVILLVLAGSITGLVGRFFCLAIPERVGAAKPMIIISVILEVVALGASVLNNANSLAGGRILPLAASAILTGVGAVLSIVSAILFLLFARSVATYIRRYELADKAMSVLKLWGACVACYIAGLVIMLLGGAMAGAAGPGAGGGMMAGACIGSILMLVTLVIALIALVQYATLLSGLSQATAKYAHKARRKEEEEEEYDEEDDEEEYEEEHPSSRSGRADRHEDDEEDDRRGRSGRTRQHDDYEDDEDDRPQRGPNRKR